MTAEPPSDGSSRVSQVCSQCHRVLDQAGGCLIHGLYHAKLASDAVGSSTTTTASHIGAAASVYSGMVSLSAPVETAAATIAFAGSVGLDTAYCPVQCYNDYTSEVRLNNALMSGRWPQDEEADADSS